MLRKRSAKTKIREDEGLLSLSALHAKCNQPVLRWTVRAIIEYRRTKGSKSRTNLTLEVAMRFKGRAYPRSFIIYRAEIKRLLNASKSAFEQLILELPCLMGFRNSEVANWRIEHIRWVEGQTLVLDAKKHVLMPIPLNLHVAKLAMEVIGDRTSGVVLKSRSKAYQNSELPLSHVSIWRVWRKWAFKLDLYPRPEDYTPVMGRRYFACKWFHELHLSLVTLSHLMRHSDPKQTLDYVNHLIFADDVEQDYREFERRANQDLKVKI